MSRLIDADALIAYCDKNWIPLNVNAVNAQPTVEPQQWNEFSPDDERLKDHYFYLISHKNYDTPIKAKWHEEGYWTEPFTGETLYWRHDEDTRDNVSAWMYLPEKYKGDGDDKKKYEPYIEAEKALEQLPSAQHDIVEVVRCKDCKHGRPYKQTKEYVSCEVDCEPIDRDSDFFCKDGERRE